MADAPLWTAGEIAAAVGGSVSAEFSVSGVSIDTRSLEPGDLFVALAGVRDGHEFVAQALAKGAAGSLTARTVDGPYVQAPDVFHALEALGVASRARPTGLKCAAVTGSVGKTSVTQAMAAALFAAGRGHSSVKSYNNHIGVPLTLARMPKDTERAVFEVGMNHADEISPLTRMVRPHVAVVTTVGPVHTENFPDGETGVAKAKAEIFEGLEPGGLAVLNADNPWFDLLAAKAVDCGARVARFGAVEGCDARLISLTPDPAGQLVTAELHRERISFPIAQTGAHWGPNCMAILLACEALDVDLAITLEALRTFGPLAGRGQERALNAPGGGYTLVDESYNANPISMTAVISALGARKTSGRRIVVLTDMLELGPEELALHAQLSDPIAKAGIDRVFCAGPRMEALWSVLPEGVKGGYALTALDLAPVVRAQVREGDVVLVKGSNGSRAGAIVEWLVHGEGA
jgi:UDP-N-acetylmuramoyl-tripeptide--D-alanyl-D-alanine ligase